jgi:transposase
MRPSGTPEALEARRRVAARLFSQGKSLAEVAASVGSSVSSASRWKEAWRHGGVRALRAKPHPGPEPRLALRQERQLLAALKRGSRSWGYAPDGWTGPLVQDLIWRLFGVDYHPDYVGTLLHRLGWSAQKPEQRARERHEAVIARWRSERWPQLKKEHRAAS